MVCQTCSPLPTALILGNQLLAGEKVCVHGQAPNNLWCGFSYLRSSLWQTRKSAPQKEQRDTGPLVNGYEKRYKVGEHTVAAAADVIKALYPPPEDWLKGLLRAIASAADIFAGYIMLEMEYE